MTFLSQVAPLAQVGTYIRTKVGQLVHIRTATKRVSGSRTNKNDSAGRRLGPKVYENHFVKTGQIIMRQRGTKIHPGENVGIGRDHTIFALEPGYVKFYLDPFHPLRKFVGVALKRELSLPTPHFAPRVRRFGYVPLKGEYAKREEEHMSRKEHKATPELQARAAEAAQKAAETLEQYEKALPAFVAGILAENAAVGARRLLFVAQRLRFGDSLEAAAEQATFNDVHDLGLAVRRGELTAEAAEEQKAALLAFLAEFDAKVSVDYAGGLYAPYSAEALKAKQDELMAELAQFRNTKISAEARETILSVLATPGVFSKAQRVQLKHELLPKVLPETVPGTVVEVADKKKVPKNVIPVRRFNEKERKVDVVYRTKDAFLA